MLLQGLARVIVNRWEALPPGSADGTEKRLEDVTAVKSIVDTHSKDMWDGGREMAELLVELETLCVNLGGGLRCGQQMSMRAASRMQWVC